MHRRFSVSGSYSAVPGCATPQLRRQLAPPVFLHPLDAIPIPGHKSFSILTPRRGAPSAASPQGS